MSSTKTDEPSSDDFVNVEKTDAADTTSSDGLTATKLEQHNNESNNITTTTTNEGVTKAQPESTTNKPEAETPEEAEAPEVTPSQAGAGLLFGISGLVIGGPLLALLAGVGAAVVAKPDNETPAGDAARASGDFAIETTSKVSEAVGGKAKEANEEYGIIDKIKQAFTTGWTKVKDFDEEHKVSEKTKETASSVGARGVEFEKEHHFVEKFLGGVKGGVDFLMGKLKDATGEGGCVEGCSGKNATVEESEGDKVDAVMVQH
mmetsp:Transcript_8722/g.15782  ORF Transcript_8722/g.15782 Transcript_8722/m.15782 type:complete len:261 (-) Transcript_8722:170-952(-)|eukprot:CAMPEP_0201605582 /NCGR_PEP_ID=MMETSP0492-20130828/5346_1 /ASSEMBLY_ACC=CAM_ASM_000837 /TAXON_ID=420259 /ORGANISM="Thalassiosira gravida, Strain GMp14c1" /LENGTH=260 /DNA_ID=CAMNT_0048069853 /DNA_START=228 /DNA_END=1010 /DNA_ORIENTATION=+